MIEPTLAVREQHSPAPGSAEAECGNVRRVALFITDLTGGGAERTLINLASALADIGVEVDLVLVRATGPFMDTVPSTVRVIDLKSANVLFAVLPLARYLARQRPDALVSALNQPNIAAVLARKIARLPLKTITTIHNTLSVEAKQLRLKPKLMLQFVRYFANWSDAVVCVSQGVADDYKKITGLPVDKVHVIYNSVVSESIQKRSREPVDHPWFEKGQPPVLLSVGRLNVQKDYVTLLQAFAHVKRRGRFAARLMMIGEGEERPALRRLIMELGLQDDVEMPGFMENPYKFMHQARLLVLSSRWEGLPTVLIESMACGTPVVATNCPSGPYEILDGGRFGALSPVGDPVALAGNIEAGLATPKVAPPPESWYPYRCEVGANRYFELLTAP